MESKGRGVRSSRNCKARHGGLNGPSGQSSFFPYIDKYLHTLPKHPFLKDTLSFADGLASLPKPALSLSSLGPPY